MIQNCFEPAWQHRNQTVRQWGQDKTGLIEYQLNSQGFRSPVDYTQPPDYAFFGNSIVFGIGLPQHQILSAQFSNSQNYGLSGKYMNHHSVTNLKQFVNSALYSNNTKIVFFWIDRDEPIEDMIQQVNQIATVLHISSGTRRTGAINLMPHKDSDVSGTHPGPLTHVMWAKTIQQLINRG
jgi:hypothetical protein